MVVRAKRIEMPRLGEPGHQAVTGAGAESGTDVEPGPDRDHDDAAEHHRRAGDEKLGFGQQREHDVDDEADLDRIEDRAEAHRLAERDPQHQQRNAGDDRHLADGEPGQLGHARVEHVPRRCSEIGVDQQRDADAEDGEPEHASTDALGRAIGGPESMHSGTLTTGFRRLR